MIELQQLGVRFGGMQALQAVSARLVAPVVGVIGPNGAGKSTLLDALCGLVPVLPGSRLLLDGSRIEGWSPRQRALAGLRRGFQSPQLAPGRSVADNVAVMLDALPLDRPARAAALRSVLRLAGLSAQQHRPCSHLGPFERRCVEVARGLAGGARLLLLDEPAAGLGAAERQALARLLARIHTATGAQTLLVEHDIGLVAGSCAQTLVLLQGRVLACGPTPAVLADPAVREACIGPEGGP